MGQQSVGILQPFFFFFEPFPNEFIFQKKHEFLLWNFHHHSVNFRSFLPSCYIFFNTFEVYICNKVYFTNCTLSMTPCILINQESNDLELLSCACYLLYNLLTSDIKPPQHNLGHFLFIQSSLSTN